MRIMNVRKFPFFFYLMCVTLLGAFTACSSDDEPLPDSIELSDADQNLITEGMHFDGTATTTQSFSFETSNAWKAVVSETATRAASWCKVEPQSGKAGNHTVTISTEKNSTGDTRSAEVSIICGTKTLSFKVTQKPEDALTLTKNSFSVSAEGGEVKLVVKHNLAFEVEIDKEAAAWLTQVNTRALTETEVVLNVAANQELAAREAKVIIKSGTLKETITITQQGLASSLPAGLSTIPSEANADEALKIVYKVTNGEKIYGQSALYVHIGAGTEDAWEHVITTWGQNEDKFKMTNLGDNTWSLDLTPTVREWFASGEMAINKIGVVIRSADAQSQTADLFITVKDDKYKAFEPAAIKYATMPAGVVEGINIIDNSTVTLVLYDKDLNGNHKDYAYVVGDFNKWTLSNDENGQSQMYRDDAAGCWWITLTNLSSTDEVAFQYYVGTKEDGSMRLADPYTEKIFDPDNDKWISSSTYPGNLTYPEGAKGVVSTFQIQEDEYAWKVSDFTIAEPNNLVIYEMHLRDFTKSGDLNGALAKLDYLKAMGVNAIELMPTQEFDGNDSWGYNPCFFFAMDKAYGTKKMYKEFIDICHQNGIAVILDVVYNHATGAHPFAKLYWDSANNKTAKNNPWFNVDAPHPYSVFHDFNHESELVRKFVKRNLQFLLTEYKLDGFRFDLTKGFTQNAGKSASADNSAYDASRIAILKDYNAAIKAVKADAFVVLEHFCADAEEKELAADGLHMWNNLNNAYCQSAMAWGENSSFASMYRSTPNWVGFMESHDEERMGYKQVMWGHYDMQTNLTTRMKQLAVNTAFFLTVPGPKMIWQFGELGYDVSINANSSGEVVNGEEHRTDRKPIRWEYFDNADRKGLYDTYCKLMQLRNGYPELFDEATFSWNVSNVTHNWNSTTQVETGNWLEGRSLYSESVTGKKLMVLGNFTHDTKAVSLPKSGLEGTWTNYMTGETETVGATVNVPAHSFVVYVVL